MNQQRETMRCPLCVGNGTKIIQGSEVMVFGAPGLFVNPQDAIEVPCPECDGTGILPLPPRRRE